MSFQDTTTKQYMSEPAVFADAFNYLIYGGRQVIRPELLTDLDATQFAIPYGENEQGKPEATQKYRDVLKTLAVKTDDRCTYLVLGIENLTSTPLKIDKNAEVIDMCEAIQGMMNDKMQQGMQQGRKLGMQQGRKQGMREANLATALRLMKMGLTAQQIAEATQLPEAEILQLQRNNAQ